MCSTWEGGSGANACFVTEPENLTGALSALPDDGPAVEREARILEWRVSDDGVSESDRASFFIDSAYLQLPEATRRAIPDFTRLGGVPSWIQSADETPQDGWRFIGQLDSTYTFLRAPTVEMDGVRKDEEGWKGRSHYCEGPNFGDGGIAYLFLRSGSGVPEGWFFWQCG